MAENNDNKAALAALGIGGAAGIIASIALAKKASASSGVPDDIKQLLIAIAEANAQLVLDVENILANLPSGGSVGGGGPGVGYPDNADAVATTRITIAQINRGYQLPDLTIPAGMKVLILAPVTNVGTIYVANSRTSALDLDSAYPLVAGAAIHYYVKNSNKLQISGNTVGDVAVMTVEINGGV